MVGEVDEVDEVDRRSITWLMWLTCVLIQGRQWDHYTTNLTCGADTRLRSK